MVIEKNAITLTEQHSMNKEFIVVRRYSFTRRECLSSPRRRCGAVR